MDPYPRTWAEIDLGALSANLQRLREVAKPAGICLVAKADAYGHGLVPISRHAVREGVEALAVATVAEGIALREAGISCSIMVLSPVLAVEVETAVFYELELTAEEPGLLREMGMAGRRQGRSARFHLKVDTGLHRFGCRVDQVVEVARSGLSEGLTLAGLTTHFVDSGQMREETEKQHGRFLEAASRLESEGIRPEKLHCANSNGLLNHPVSKHSMARVGMLAYGIDGVPGSLFRPVMSLKTRVVADRLVEEGDSVGYGATWRASRPSRIVTLGAGYGDGVPRRMSGRGSVSIRGKRLPLVGLICMDLMMVDATEAPEVEVGDVAVILGEGITAKEMASQAETNSHEIVTRIAPRVPRRYIGR